MNDIALPEKQPTPLTILESALARGVDADQLGKLVELQERWTKARAVEAFNQAMRDCQAEIMTVVKDAAGVKGANFARLETVQAAAKPVYTKYGFSMSFSEGQATREGHMRIVCQVCHVQGDCREHYIELPYDGSGSRGQASAMNAVQAVGSTFSYGCRYLTVRIFAITIANEDNDGDTAAEPCTPEMIEAINQAWADCEAAGLTMHWDKFMKWLNVDGLANLPASQFPKVIAELNRKRRAAK